MGVNEVATTTQPGRCGWLPGCGSNKSHGNIHFKNGAYFDYKIGGFTKFKTTPIKLNDGTIDRKTSLGANGMLELTVGKANEDRSNFFEFTVQGYGGTDFGGKATLKNTKLFAQSRNEYHEGGWNVELSTEYNQTYRDLLNQNPDDYQKGFNPQYSSIKTDFTMGPQYSYKDRLFIGVNGGVQHTYSNGYNEFGPTGNIEAKYYFPLNGKHTGVPFAPYLKLKVGAYTKATYDESAPLKLNFGKTEAAGELTLGASLP